MDCSSRLVHIVSACAIGVLGTACSSFVSPEIGETDAGSSSSGASSITTSPGPSSAATTDESSSTTGGSSSTTDDTSPSTTDGSTSAASSTTDASTSGTSSTSGAGTESSSESGDPCLMGELCGRVCVDTETDLANCGGCDDLCGDDNAAPSCSVGECTLNCEDGFDSCDADDATGCEQSLQTPEHCGACDAAGVAEICDGLDNDCAAGLVIDEGCPDGITLEGGTFDGHDQFGNAIGGTAFTDVCPGGSALVGFSGNVGGNIDRLQGVCAVMSLETDTTVTPYTYAITSGATTALPVHGGNLTTPFTLGCPDDNFIVGVSGEASDFGLHEVTIHCATVLIDGLPGAFEVTYGPITTQTVDGTNDGTAYSDLLATPAVVDRYRGRAGAWVDNIGIGEANVTLSVVE